MKGCLGSAFAALLIVLILGAISWIATCSIVYLVTLCFGWEFNWLIATGIWIMLCVIQGIYSHK